MRPVTTRPRRVAERRRRVARSWRQPRWRTAAATLALATAVVACGAADDRGDLAASDDGADMGSVASPAERATAGELAGGATDDDSLDDGSVDDTDTAVDDGGTASDGSDRAPRGEQVIRDAAIDYHRVSLADPVDQVLARFLIGRRPKKRKGGGLA